MQERRSPAAGMGVAGPPEAGGPSARRRARGPCRRPSAAALRLVLLLGLLASPAVAGGDDVAPTHPAAGDPGSSGAGSTAGAPPPREAMEALLGALALALPRSADPERFGDPAARGRVEDALRTLAEASGVLERHVGRGEGFRLLGAALARDAREVARRYAAGRHGEAGYLLQRLTENCIACHHRLPETSGPRLDRHLGSPLDLQGLAPAERARLQIATRRFDAALETYETLFASPQTSPAQLDRMGYLADYLTVALRVKSDPERARATLRRLRVRPGVPDWLERDLRVWIDALEDPLPGMAAQRDAPSPLERARRLLAEGEALREVPADHTGLVHDLLASSLVYRFVETPLPSASPSDRDPEAGAADVPEASDPAEPAARDPARPADSDPSEAERAEPYYLLGVAEARIDRSYWLSPADLYLETAIRTAPQAPFARDAYELLERRTREGYTGSAGTHLPEDVKRNLEALRRLVERGAPGRQGEDG